MSQRHRQGRNRSPESRAEKREKRLEKRRERHAVRATLMATEPDEVVLPQAARIEHEELGAPPRTSSRRRHWKMPFWKRRNAMRHERNEAWRRLAEEA